MEKQSNRVEQMSKSITQKTFIKEEKINIVHAIYFKKQEERTVSTRGEEMQCILEYYLRTINTEKFSGQTAEFEVGWEMKPFRIQLLTRANR